MSGGGQIGDWGCHVPRGIFKTLDHLRYPERVEIVKATEFNGERFPEGMTSRWHFGARAGKPTMDMNLPLFRDVKPGSLRGDILFADEDEFLQVSDVDPSMVSEGGVDPSKEGIGLVILIKNVTGP